MTRVGRIGSFPTTSHNTVGKYAYEISKQPGLESIVFCPKMEGRPLTYSGIKQIRTFTLWARRDIKSSGIRRLVEHISWFGWLIRLQFEAIRLFKGRGLDVVHTHSQMYTLVALWAKLSGKKVFITFHGEDYNNLQKSKLLQQLLFCYDSVFVISPAMTSGVKSIFNGPVIYTPNGIDLDTFTNKAETRTGNLLCVGSFKTVKRHDLLIRAFAELVKHPENTGRKLILAGKGPLEEEVRKSVTDLSLNNNVVFVGNLTSQELSTHYNQATCLILCSDREGFPKVILEGLACGIKIASTPVGAVPEVLGVDYPYFFDDMTPVAMSQLIHRLIHDNETLSCNLEQYSWDKLRTTIMQHYDK